MKRSATYYRVQGVVRTAFWLAVGTAGLAIYGIVGNLDLAAGNY